MVVIKSDNSNLDKEKINKLQKEITPIVGDMVEKIGEIIKREQYTHTHQAELSVCISATLQSIVSVFGGDSKIELCIEMAHNFIGEEAINIPIEEMGDRLKDMVQGDKPDYVG